MKSFECSICGKVEEGYGHNPEPIYSNEERCCEECNNTAVIPARIIQIQNK